MCSKSMPASHSPAGMAAQCTLASHFRDLLTGNAGLALGATLIALSGTAARASLAFESGSYGDIPYNFPLKGNSYGGQRGRLHTRDSVLIVLGQPGY